MDQNKILHVIEKETHIQTHTHRNNWYNKPENYFVSKTIPYVKLDS